MTYLLTAEMLRSKFACEKQVMIFESEWPNGMPLDESVVPRIVDLKLSIDWFAGRFLKPAALDEYNRVTAPARSEYRRVEDAAWDEYKRVEATAWAEYDSAKDTAWSEYKRVEAPVWTEYERAKATAAIRIYRAQESK